MPSPTYNMQQEMRLKFISALYSYFRVIREVKHSPGADFLTYILQI